LQERPVHALFFFFPPFLLKGIRASFSSSAARQVALPDRNLFSTDGKNRADGVGEPTCPPLLFSLLWGGTVFPFFFFFFSFSGEIARAEGFTCCHRFFFSPLVPRPPASKVPFFLLFSLRMTFPLPLFFLWTRECVGFQASTTLFLSHRGQCIFFLFLPM